MALMAGITLFAVGAIFIILSLRGFDREVGPPNVVIWQGIHKLVTGG